MSDFFLSLGETTTFGFYCLIFYFVLFCWDWWGLQSSYLCHIFVHHLSVENGLLLLCCVDLRPSGVEETWGRCVWTNPLLLSRKISENSILCLALVAIVSHGAAVSMLQVFCPFASNSLMSNAQPRARSGVVFFPLLPHPPTCLPTWIFNQWSCEDESELKGRNCGVCVSVMLRTMSLWLWWHQCYIKHTLRLLKMPSTSSWIHRNKSNHMYLMLSITILVANSWCNRY